MDDNFVIDLTRCTTTAELINGVSIALEIPDTKGKDVILKLKDFQLNQSQLLSIKSLIETYGAVLKGVETSSLITKQLCESMNLQIIGSESSARETTDFRELRYKNDVFEELSKEFIDTTAVPQNLTESDVKITTENESSSYEIESIEDTKNEAEEEHFENIPQDNDVKTFQESVKETSKELPQENYDSEVLEVKDDYVQVQNVEHYEENIEHEPNYEQNENNDIPLNQEQEYNQNDNIQETQQPIMPSEERLQESFDNLNMLYGDEIKQPVAEGEEVEVDGEKKTIGVYTKAQNEDTELDDFEEVNFYAPPTDEPVVTDTKDTLYVSQTLRSGQVVDYDGNVVIIGNCHPGSEIKATGDITVWGVLASVAHAGAKGNREAKIRALAMNAVQLRIADCYSRRPDGTNVPYVAKDSSFVPEEARIVDNNIILFKMNQKG